MKATNYAHHIRHRAEVICSKLNNFQTNKFSKNMVFAKINVNRGSSFFKMNGCEFLVVKTNKDSVYISINGNTVSFNNSEIILQNVEVLDYLDKIESDIETCSEHDKIVYVKILDSFRSYYQRNNSSIDFPDLNRFQKFYGLGRNHFIIKALSVLN